MFENKKINIHLMETDRTAIKLAAESLQSDLHIVFGASSQLSTYDVAEIVIMCLSDEIEETIEMDNLHLEHLYDEYGELHKEGYLLEKNNDRLFIIGTDMRGTIYGIYELSEMIGISPWHFFADVPAKKKNNFYIEEGFFKTDFPSVEYRGIFINDEEELDAWAKTHTNDGTIGPETYIHIFDLLLRLKANYIWPAMHVNYFNGNPENARLANQMGLVVGTSHPDMLLRSNQNEWAPWLEQKGYKDIAYDYSITGKNRSALLEYWRESVETNKDYEVSYTIGMRGIHDSEMIASQIDNDLGLNSEQKFERKRELLEQVMKAQGTILNDVIGGREKKSFKTFIPYKEVLEYYDNGLNVPDDTTIIWSNDNFGYMRRYPDQNLRSHAGGYGLYYHSSYWAPTNMSYLFISSTPLARMKNELQKSWDNGIRKLWILNVGAIKPIEQDVDFFLRFAWEINKESSTKDIVDYLGNWIHQNFSIEMYAEVGSLLNDFCQVTNVRKVEHLSSNAFSQTAYGDEAAVRLNHLRKIYDRINQIAELVPKEEAAAFFQLVQMKVHAAYYKNGEFYFADRSVLANEQGKLQAADAYTTESSKFTIYLRKMLYYYNKKMSGGKWDKILTPEIFPPPNMPLYPTVKPALIINAAKLGVELFNEENFGVQSKLIFEKNGRQSKWIEVFNKGVGKISYHISAPEWLRFEKYSGTVTTETRIGVKVLKSKLSKSCDGIVKLIDEHDNEIIIKAEYRHNLDDREENAYLEADGYVSFPAIGFIDKKDNSDTYWKIIPYLGRYQGNALEAFATEQLEVDVEQAHPEVSYSINIETSGSHILEIYRLPTLNSVGKIRLGVSVNNGKMLIVSSRTTDEWRGNWQDAVVNETEKLYVSLPFLTAGIHRITLHMIDSYVTLSKLVIYTNKFQRTSLGPIYSQVSGEKSVLDFRDEKLPIDLGLGEFTNRIYDVEENQLDFPEIIHVGTDFYLGDQTFGSVTKRSQNGRGTLKYQKSAKGLKNVVFEIAQQKIKEINGVVAFEVERALANDEVAYCSEALPDVAEGHWEHLGTPTNGGSGLGMFINKPYGEIWTDPSQAPALHYNFNVENIGEYKVWLLVKYDTKGADKLAIGTNGLIQSDDQYIGHKTLFSFKTMQVWHWHHLSQITLSKGNNTFSIYGISSQVKLDRIYLTKGNELPPLDKEWDKLS